MKIRLTAILIISLLATVGFLGFNTFESEVVSAGNTIYVGSGPGNDSATINGGISLASDGDTVFVYSGTYIENIGIWNTINLIGEDKETTIIDGGGPVKVVEIYSDWVNVTGFTITNGMVGFFVSSASNITIKDNIVRDIKKAGGVWGNGFFFSGSPYSDNKIIGNDVYENEADGIHFEDQSSIDEFVFQNNSIINNTVYNNTNDGIIIAQGTNNFIIDNFVYHNGLASINPVGGIHLWWSSNNVIKGNTLHNNDNGIYLEKSINKIYTINNTIDGNIVYNNDNAGIRVREASENTFFNNSIFNNSYNVFMERQSAGNNFINCSLSNATLDDFNLSDDSHAILLNTTFNKTRVYYGDTLSTLSVNWYMHVNVRYYNESPASGASIWVNDTYGSNIVNGSVNSQGWKRWIVVNEYVEQDLNGDHIGEKIFYYTPHHVSATDGFYWGYANPVMDISKVVLIYLGVPPPLLPPTNLTTKTVNNGNNIELEWDPPPSFTLDHYLIYRADSATEFDFSVPYNNSLSWSDPLNTTWIDPDPGITAVDDDFYYIIRAANFDETDISSTSNTAGVWTRTVQPGTSTFSLPLEPYTTQNIESLRQDMNASYIKWMDPILHKWMKHGEGVINDTQLILGKGYEAKFENQSRYTFCGMPGAQIKYHSKSAIGFNPASEADSLYATVSPITGEISLFWQQPSSMWDPMNHFYKIYRSTTRDGFFDGTALHVVTFPVGPMTWKDSVMTNPNTQYYYIIVPVNGTGFEGASSYSIGVFTMGISSQYDTIGIPLRLHGGDKNADYYCNNILESVGINYYINNEQRWGWHSERMPQGIYDVDLEMTHGYQISTSGITKFTFIGR